LNRPINLKTKLKYKIVTQFPALDKDDIPDKYAVSLIDHRREEIEKYNVIFWHRLLRSIYNGPLEIQCEVHTRSNEESTNVETVIFRNTHQKNNWEVIGIDEAFTSDIEAGKIKIFPVNWKYLVRLPSGGILELGTKDRNTVFHIAQVTPSRNIEKHDTEDAKKFINLILDQANRQSGQLFNPTKEFEKQKSLKFYLLFNVYLSNYLSAMTMLDIAESQETDLREEFLRYDARMLGLYDYDEEKKKHIDQFSLKCGMFYCSAITYFFMALEGFVNLVFHSFLKKEFRDKDFRTDQRLDLEQKLRFMTSLCNGFEESSDVSSAILTRFKTLKNYRNSLFHSKIEDSLKTLCFVEDGFIYNYDMEEYKERFLSSHKIKLTFKDVIEVKSIVNEIVSSILKSMNKDTRMVTENYILKEPQIPFFVSETGDLVIGKRELA